MQDLWNRLEAYFQKRAPEVLDSLNPPATEEQTRQAETELQLVLPADLVASLRVHNGQVQFRSASMIPREYSEIVKPRTSVLYEPDRPWGIVATYGELLSIEQVVRHTFEERYGLPVPPDIADSFEFHGPVRRDGDWSWVSIVDPGSGDRIGLDMNPAPGGQVGQVLSIVHDPPRLFVLAPSYRVWFEQLVERYESGRYAIVGTGKHAQSVDRLNPDWEETVG